MYNQKFVDANSAKRGQPEEDRKLTTQVEENFKLTDTGHYEIVILFRDMVPTLPNNKKSEFKRLDSLRERLVKDDRSHKDYCEFMST